MGLETILALAIQGTGSAVGAGLGAIPGLGTAGAIGTGTGTSLAGAVTGGATTASQALAGAAGASAVPGTGVLGTGLTGAQAATGAAQGLSTIAGLAPAFASKPKQLQAREKDIETGVGEETQFRGKKKRSVSQTVQGGGLKRNTLG